jgi:hypothetical protein
MLFRKDKYGWVISEVGEHAAAADWFGTAWRTSCIGKRVEEMPAGDKLAPVFFNTFQTLNQNQSVRLDHICTVFPNMDDTALIPVSFKRLVLTTVLADGTPALLAVVERTHDIRISDLPENLRLAMPLDCVSDSSL